MTSPRYPARRTPAILPACTHNGFMRGLVTTACLSAFQAPNKSAKEHNNHRRIIRHALQGGTALAAGECAAAAWAQRNYSRAITAAAFGAAGVLLIERLLGTQTSATKENS